MDWIKKNYDRFILAVAAVALIAVAVMLFLATQGFKEKFAEAMSQPARGTKIPAVDTARITAAKEGFEKPALWDTANHGGLLFTSERYYVKDGTLHKADPNSSLHTHSRTGDPIPDGFFSNNGLPLFDANVQFADPDGDGFSNEDEWLNGGKGLVGQSTDPNKKDSHPPYYTQLYLSNTKRETFRLKFQVYNGDPKGPVEKMEFQINPLDLRQGITEFLKIGETVKGTTFKVKSFQFKEIPNKATGEVTDVSELTVVNTETGEEIVLPKEKVVNSPTQFIDFLYFWNKKHGDQGQVISHVPKGKEFVLQPEVTVKYKLLDVDDTKAVIQLPDGKTYDVLPVKK